MLLILFFALHIDEVIRGASARQRFWTPLRLLFFPFTFSRQIGKSNK
jgi:hypothetical protein